MGVGREGVLFWVTKQARCPKAVGQMRVVSLLWYSAPCTRPCMTPKIIFYTLVVLLDGKQALLVPKTLTTTKPNLIYKGRSVPGLQLILLLLAGYTESLLSP